MATHRTTTPQQRELLQKAYGLLGDGQGEEWRNNPEYTRAIVNLVSRVLGYGQDDYDIVLDLIRESAAKVERTPLDTIQRLLAERDDTVAMPGQARDIADQDFIDGVRAVLDAQDRTGVRSGDHQ